MRRSTPSASRAGFQSTPPEWEATIDFAPNSAPPSHFNPRLPSGRRLYPLAVFARNLPFQSTPPEWEAT